MFLLSEKIRKLREKVHESIEMYVAKKTAYTHVTSRIDLERF